MDNEQLGFGRSYYLCFIRFYWFSGMFVLGCMSHTHILDDITMYEL